MTTLHGQTEKDRRLIALTVLAFLALGTYVVMSPFLVSIAWAIILVFVTWPVYRFLRSPLGHRPALTAGLMTLLLTFLIIVPVGFLVFAAVEELGVFVRQVGDWLRAPEIPDAIKALPLVGSEIEPFVKKYIGAPEEGGPETRQIKEAAVAAFGFAQGLVGGIAGVVFKIAMCLFTAYFLYRHGELLAGQVARVAIRVGGPRYEGLLNTIRATVRAAVYGVLLTAVAQGFLAGIGFYVVGAPVPLLLALATVVASLIPFAPPIIYLGAAGAMLARGDDWWWPAGLALWGISVVSTADNVIRPLFISQATHTPLLLVFFGVIGGIVAFGLIGVILGPVILTVAMVLWKEWAQAEDGGDPALDTGHA
jgi:predicted PurR-regulated permease PerM